MPGARTTAAATNPLDPGSRRLRIASALLACLLPVAGWTGNPDTGFSSGIDLDAPRHPGAQSGPPAQAGPAADWWRSQAQNSRLTIRSIEAYPDAPGDRPAVALRLSRPLAPDNGYNDHLAVYDPDTLERVPGSWRLADDPRLLYFVLPASGTYIVRVRAGLEDRAGHTLNKSVSGPVSVP